MPFDVLGFFVALVMKLLKNLKARPFSYSTNPVNFCIVSRTQIFFFFKLCIYCIVAEILLFDP